MLQFPSYKAALLLPLALLVACSPIAAPPSGASSEMDGQEPIVSAPVEQAASQEDDVAELDANEEAVRRAQEDLADRLDVSIDRIVVREVRAVTWPDASLGCPEPDQVYAQVEQEGLLIRLSAGDEMYFYHSGGDQAPFLCENTNQILPQVTPKTDEFVPPPDSEID